MIGETRTSGSTRRCLHTSLLMLFCIVGSLALISCATPVQSAQNALTIGDYSAAIETSLQALQKEPDSMEAKQILSDAWKAANNEWSKAIAGYELEEDVWLVGKSLVLYEDLFHIHTLLKESQIAGFDADPTGVYARWEATKDRVVEKHVFEGSKFLASGNRVESQVALEHFTRAKELGGGTEFIDMRIQEAQEAALTKIFVFNGPDTNIALNSAVMIPAIEKELAQLEGVRVVSVQNRSAAPIDENHDAVDMARMLGANMMLHFEPETTHTVLVQKNIQELTSVPWKRETLSLVASAAADVRYVLLDLQNDTIISEGVFTIRDSTDGGFSVSAVLHDGMKQEIDMGGSIGWRELSVNVVPPNMKDITVLYQLNRNDGLDIPEYASGRSLDVRAALLDSGEQIVFDQFPHPSELASINALNGHTFWLFDAILFDNAGDGNTSHQFVYRQDLQAGLEGHLATALYERELYLSLESWMQQRKIKDTMMDQFLPNFYKQTVPSGIAAHIAPLL